MVSNLKQLVSDRRRAAGRKGGLVRSSRKTEAAKRSGLKRKIAPSLKEFEDAMSAFALSSSASREEMQAILSTIDRIPTLPYRDQVTLVRFAKQNKFSLKAMGLKGKIPKVHESRVRRTR